MIQEIAPNRAKALEAGIGLAQKIAACGPLGIKTTLESAHLSIDQSAAASFAKLNEQFGGLFRTEDFIEGRKAEAEGVFPSTEASGPLANSSTSKRVGPEPLLGTQRYSFGMAALIEHGRAGC